MTETAYVERTEFKAWANIRNDDHDDELDEILLAASRDVDNACHRDFTPAGDAATARSFSSSNDGRYLLVDDFLETIAPTATVDGRSVDVTVVPHSSQRPAGSLKGAFGCDRTVVVTARWGWEDVPTPVKTATKMVALKLWERRNSPYGTQGNAEIGYLRIAGTDRDVEQLLSPYVRLARRLGA